MEDEKNKQQSIFMDYYDEIHDDEIHERNKLNPMYIKDMSAEEAKGRADAYVQKRENEDFKFIMSHIINAANHGDYKITFNREYNISLTDAIKNKLETLGYKVKVQTIQDNFYRIVISWKGEEE